MALSERPEKRVKVETLGSWFLSIAHAAWKQKQEYSNLGAHRQQSVVGARLVYISNTQVTI